MNKTLLHRFLTLIIPFMMCVTAMSAQITVSISGKPLKEALQSVEKQSGYSFFYSTSLVGLNSSVSVNAVDKDIDFVMKALLAGLDIDYAVKSDKQITLFQIQKADNKPLQSASRRVIGFVKDDKGQPVIGATVMVQGTTTGTVADVDGSYKIDLPSADAVLAVSYLGYKSQTIEVGGRTNIDITLEDENQVLQEVVVVGYGTQKKVNLTGSVAVVDSKDIESRPMTNLASGLQGLLPGVTVRNTSGQPGASSTSITVRGLGTIGNTSPLVLIDGVEGDMTILNPEDIQSVTVLKDAASSSIYGARAANGVLLVTTKKLNNERQKPTITFNAYVGLQTPTRLPEMCDAIEFMTLDNEARSNIKAPVAWNQDHFDKVKNNTDPNRFGNTNWIGEVLKKVAPQQNYGLSVSGNFGNSGYMLSYRYLDQDGLTVGNSTGEQRHNLRYKMDSKLLDIVTISSNINFTTRKIVSPVGSLSSDGGAIYNAMRIAPNVPMYYTDDTWAYGGGNTNPVAVLYDGGRTTTNSDEISVQESVKVDILKGWDVTATYNVTVNNYLRESLRKTIIFTNPDDGSTYSYNSPNSLSNSDQRQIQQTFIAQSNFNFDIRKHNISGVVGMSQEWLTRRYFTASRTGLSTEQDPTLNLGSSSSMSNDANATKWALRSGFARLCYNYDERYLFEANLRYDLSSRFHPKNRGGWFPSFSAAWRLTEESFMKVTRKYLDNFKIRASWGMLGNQYVSSSDYPYLSVLQQFTDGISLIGGNATNGYVQTTLSNPYLSWEKIKMLDIGFDFAMFSNRLTFSFDWFTKDTDGILLQLKYPSQIGATPSEENVGSVNNRGWEIDLNWRDKIGKVSYGVGFNLSDVKNKITDLGSSQPDLSGDQIRRVGDPIDAFYGYVSEGLMTPSDFDVYDEANKKYMIPNVPVVIGNDYQPGDIKYKDISGPNGVPDGRITPEYDKIVIGSNIPRYTYNIKGYIEYFGFDFSFSLQGVGKCNGYLKGSARHAFQDMAAYPQKVHLDRYSLTENPNANASYPRLTYNTSFNQSTFSTFWLEDASYLRLKTIQLGYTLPQALTRKARIEKCRFYITADNLFTASKFFYAYDPETPVSNGGYYPQVRTFVLGINLTFK